MTNQKVWHKIEIATEEQNMSIWPSPNWDGIVFSIKELGDNSKSINVYINEPEMWLLIERMKDMMRYVKQDN